MTITMELPETLTSQFQERRIPEKEIKAFVVAALEVWLAQPPEENTSSFEQSAVPFTQRLIAQNRALFEKLAQR